MLPNYDNADNALVACEGTITHDLKIANFKPTAANTHDEAMCG